MCHVFDRAKLFISNTCCHLRPRARTLHALQTHTLSLSTGSQMATSVRNKQFCPVRNMAHITMTGFIHSLIQFLLAKIGTFIIIAFIVEFNFYSISAFPFLTPTGQRVHSEAAIQEDGPGRHEDTGGCQGGGEALTQVRHMQGASYGESSQRTGPQR